MERIELDPDAVTVCEITLGGPDGGGGVGDALRPFGGDIVVFDEVDVPAKIGRISGYVGLRIRHVDIWDAADHISTDIEVLGVAAREIVGEADRVMTQALFVDRVFLEPRYRGNKVWRSVVDSLFEIMYLDPIATIVVTQPEPQQASGEFHPYGPERDAAMGKLLDACRVAGLEQWSDSAVWWLPYPELDESELNGGK